jgi:hypothetical protein
VDTSIGKLIVRGTGGSFWYVLLMGVVWNKVRMIIGLGVYLARLESNRKFFSNLLAQVVSTSAGLTQQKGRPSE